MCSCTQLPIICVQCTWLVTTIVLVFKNSTNCTVVLSRSSRSSCIYVHIRAFMAITHLKKPPSTHTHTHMYVDERPTQTHASTICVVSGWSYQSVVSEGALVGLPPHNKARQVETPLISQQQINWPPTDSASYRSAAMHLRTLTRPNDTRVPNGTHTHIHVREYWCSISSNRKCDKKDLGVRCTHCNQECQSWKGEIFKFNLAIEGWSKSWIKEQQVKAPLFLSQQASW